MVCALPVSSEAADLSWVPAAEASHVAVPQVPSRPARVPDQPGWQENQGVQVRIVHHFPESSARGICFAESAEHAALDGPGPVHGLVAGLGLELRKWARG